MRNDRHPRSLIRSQFVRIHKSYLVAIAAVQTIDGNEVITNSVRLPLSKSYRQDVMSRIESRLFKR